MHIVINAFSARRGGGKTYLRNLLRYFPVVDNLRVTILVSKRSNLIINNSKISVYRVGFPVDNPLLRFIWEKFALPRWLKKEQADLLFCPGGIIPVSVVGSWKTVTIFRNMIPFDIAERKKYPLGYMRLRNWLLSKSLLSSMESANLVIFISTYAKSVIDKLSKEGIRKSIVIPHGVSEDFSNPSASFNSKNPFSYPYILYPSIIDVYKSQKEVVKAISILRDKGIDIPKVLMVGEVYGKYGDEVRCLINDLHLSDKVILTGPIPYLEMPALYKNAKFVIFASKSENCPNILLESMAAGRAVLCSELMPMPEFAGDAVKYFNPDSPDDLAIQLESYINDSDLVSEMENFAAERAKQYNWKVSAAMTWKALTDV